MPKISVVMPAYNAEKYIGEAIESILNQTFKDFEFIIINDGSVDHTKEIIQKYNDSRIVLLENDKNRGIVLSLNKGLDAATGEYIARMDADDIALMNRLERQAEYLDEHKDIGVLGTGICIFGEKIKEQKRVFTTNSEQLKAELIFNPCIAHPTVMIRKSVLQKYNFAFQKRFGQNFLIDTHVLDKIIDSAQITKDDFVLEIGPGIGTMTQYLAEAAREVAVEIDKTLLPILDDTLKDWDNVTVINNDILKVDIRQLALEKNQGRPIKVVANLPYYITTPIIMGLFENQVPVDSITIMVQKEVADRMQVGPGTKDYGALSLAVQYYAKPKIVANVPPNCFMPRPKVGSAVIRLERYEKPPVEVKNEKLMFRIIRASFNQRRKTLVNGLKNSQEIPFSKEQIEQALGRTIKGMQCKWKINSGLYLCRFIEKRKQ